MPAAQRRVSNISLPPQGTVCGSEQNVEKEEMFLCNRLVDDTRKGDAFLKVDWISWNNPVVSVLQGIKRPVCGMVALCMAGHLLKKHDPNITIYENDETILEVAQRLGYTKQGEMFSAKNYANLAEEIYECQTKVITETMIDSVRKILKHLASGLPVLVPYDTDRNYEPCKRKGHKAHWAILTGFVIGQQKRIQDSSNVEFPVKRITNPEELTNNFEKLPLNPSLVYLYAKQGRSARQQLWSLRELSASNANLVEVSPERDLNLFHIPQEGIKETLCSHIVFLFPRK
ncbi:actin maturation protease-like [Styela clava]